MAQKYTPIWDDWLTVTRELTAVEKGRLIDAIVAYDNGGSWQEMINGNERYVFPSYQVRLDKWHEISDMRSKASSKAEQNVTNENKIKQNETKQDKIPKVKVEDIKESTLKSTKEKPLARFTPPTVDEVAKYCSERHNGINPQAFVDFYASKGWKVGQNQMKDWKACVRTWEQRDNNTPAQKPKLVRAQMYDQRDYNEREMEDKLGVRDLFKEDAS